MNDATSLQTTHAKSGHETTDVSSRGIILFIAIMAIVIVAITGIL